MFAWSIRSLQMSAIFPYDLNEMARSRREKSMELRFNLISTSPGRTGCGISCRRRMLKWRALPHWSLRSSISWRSLQTLAGSPTKEELIAAGRMDLEEAIAAQGGWFLSSSSSTQLCTSLSSAST
ncbi:hypothetical protein MRB53_005027 [Persea americana]|uniref:Uncharacterized protein n=1 Tax=Persea americana TaxID=3435 RepID=A0ACC2MCC2_PERAE|nr:hypothetical protein MRB53_005027 [Persea americana]